MYNLGDKFRQLRLERNWSLREAAKRMGISYSYLSVLEKGMDPRTGKCTSPKPDTLRLLSDCYGYPYEELLKAAGYLNDDCTTDKIFDFQVFSKNLYLIMDGKTLENFSSDIEKKTGYKISSSQIKSYIDGDIEPFPGTINMLSKYACVSPDFWYVFNTNETLKKEQEKYKSTLAEMTKTQFDEEYSAFLNIPEEIKRWILDEENLLYIKVAFEAKKKNIKPHSLRALIDTLAYEIRKSSSN